MNIDAGENVLLQKRFSFECTKTSATEVYICLYILYIKIMF